MFSTLLNQTGTLHTPTGQTVDSARNVTRTVNSVSVSYRLEQLGTDETDLTQATGATWRLFLPAGTAVQASSTFTDADGTGYAVVGTPNRVRGLAAEHHVEALLASAAGVDA